MAVDAKTFFEVLEKQGLVSSKQLENLKKAVKKESLSESDLETVVQRQYLTSWQAKRILSGKNNFTIGKYILIDFLGKDKFGEVYLVRETNGGSPKRLRLVARDTCQDADAKKQYLMRVESIRSIQDAPWPQICEVTEIANRTVVVSDMPVGKHLGQLAGKPQPEKAVRSLLRKLIGGITTLDMADLQHGSITPETVYLVDKQIRLDLPSDVATPVNSDKRTDASAIAWVGCGLLSGDFEKPADTGSDLANSLKPVAQNPQADLEALQKAIDVSGSSSGVELLDSGTAVPEIVDVALPGDEPSAAPVAPAITPAIADPSEAGLLDLPDLPDVNADALDSIEQKDDVFGDFDQVEVVSEIQSPPAVPAGMPLVVDTPPVAQAMAPGLQSTASTPPAESEANPASKRNPMLLYSAIGGGVAVIALVVVLVILLQGNNETDKQNVARNDSNASPNRKKLSDASANPEQKENENGKSSPKSSGMFKGIGAINQDPTQVNPGFNPTGLKSNPSKKSPKNPKAKNPKAKKKKGPPKKNPTPGKLPNAKNNAKGKTDVKTGLPGPKPGTQLGKGGGQPGTGLPVKPNNGVAQKQVPGPAGKNPQPGSNNKAENDPAKIADTGPMPGDDPMEDDPVVLLGKKKNDDQKSKTPSSGELTNPFAKSPKFVELKLPRKGKDNTEFQALFPVQLPAGLPLVATLHGGDQASKSKVQFVLRASTSQDATWMVTMGTSGSMKPIGRMLIKDSQFGFSWEPEAADLVNSVYLINCAVRLQASRFIHEFQLRKPVVSSPLEFAKSFNVTADAKLDYLPNMDNVKIQLVNIPKDFAAFSYGKKKDFLTGRADNAELFFRRENIDIVKGFLSNRVRGTKLSVNLALAHVTPDKQLEKMSGIDKFEKTANAIIQEADQLQVQYNQLMAEYNKLKTREEKARFTQVTGRSKLQQQVTLAKRYKQHIQHTLEILKSIKDKKIGFRVIYQAGEIEVDLATPDGKRYVKPKPTAPAKPNAPKNKKK